MRVFILSPTYPDSEFPAANIFVYEQAKELANIGHEIIVLHVKRLPTNQVFLRIDKSIKTYNDGFSVRYCLLQKTIAESKYPLINKRAFINSAEELYKYAVNEVGIPDVIYAHFSCWAGYAAGVLSQKYGIPVVTLEHYSGFVKEKKLPRTLKSCVEFTIEHSSAFLCVSDGLRRAICNNTNAQKEIQVVPNMISREFKYEKPIAHTGFVFLAIGRLTPQKDYKTLLKAFIMAFSSSETAYLRIGGDGPERSELEAYVKDHGRTHQIQFLGQLNRKDTVNECINCDCFALSSAGETYGMVYREALVTGRPIITTDHGGFSGTDWKDEYGFRVPIRNPEAFADAMKRMVDHYNEFDGKRISEVCLEQCSPEVIVKRIERALRKAIEK